MPEETSNKLDNLIAKTYELKSNISEVETKVELLRKDVETISSKMDELEQRFLKFVDVMNSTFDKYVTLERFEPVRLIAYGAVGGVLLAVLSMILTRGGLPGITE